MTICFKKQDLTLTRHYFLIFNMSLIYSRMRIKLRFRRSLNYKSSRLTRRATSKCAMRSNRLFSHLISTEYSWMQTRSHYSRSSSQSITLSILSSPMFSTRWISKNWALFHSANQQEESISLKRIWSTLYHNLAQVESSTSSTVNILSKRLRLIFSKSHSCLFRMQNLKRNRCKRTLSFRRMNTMFLFVLHQTSKNSLVK